MKKYQIIYADPPWDYNGKLQFDKSSKDVENIVLLLSKFIKTFIALYQQLINCFKFDHCLVSFVNSSYFKLKIANLTKIMEIYSLF